MNMNRRDFVTRTPAAAVGIAGVIGAIAPRALADQAPVSDLADALYPSHDPDLVRAIVGASHGRTERVRELLSRHPALAKAAWDWGFGDWETALGAASHTGQREIAELLIASGARPNIFTFAMLGQMDVVRAVIQANPGIQRLHGPHGITLLSHAKAGGAQAAGVAEYLMELGDADIGYDSVAIPEPWPDRYLGDYSFGRRPRDRFSVVLLKGELAIKHGENGAPRRIFHQSDHAFHPAGSPGVTIRFETSDDTIAGLTVTDGPSSIKAARVAT